MLGSLFGALRGDNINIMNVFINMLALIFVVLLTLPVHEFAHAFAAVKLGDPTPKYQKRLTLNPFAHLDPIGSLMILIFGFGYAKPVQVNMRNFKNPKKGMAITAFAGPLANIIVALVMTILQFALLAIFPYNNITSNIVVFLSVVAAVNVSLAVFNLLPIPPLDGSRLMGAFLPDRIYYKVMQYERYIMIGVFILLFAGVLSPFIAFFSDGILYAIRFLVSLPFRPFLSDSLLYAIGF